MKTPTLCEMAERETERDVTLFYVERDDAKLGGGKRDACEGDYENAKDRRASLRI